MDVLYESFIKRFETLTEEELKYRLLYEHGTLPTLPDYIREQKDLQHKEDEYIPSGDIKIRKHPCFLPNYIHDHTFLEIPVVLRGQCTQHFYGETFTMEEGDALIIAPGTYHSVSVYDSYTIVVNVLFRMDLLPPLLAFESHDTRPIKQFIDDIRTGSASRTCLHIKGCYDAFYAIPELEDKTYYPLFLANAARFLALLFKSSDYAFPVAPSEKNKRLTNILESIRSKPESATLTSIAEEFGLSPGYLSMMIHEKTGLTFSALVAKQKIRKATFMLRTLDASNNEIAEAIGMTPQQFCRFFRKWMDMTPQEYRKKTDRQ